MSVEEPDWVPFFKRLGGLLASLPSGHLGATVPRVVVSVPTGRFSYWLAAAGALGVEQDLSRDWRAGDRCACLIDKQMQDVTIESVDPSGIKVSPTLSFMKDKALLAPVPSGCPEGRRAATLGHDLLTALKNALPPRTPLRGWYARHALKPVVIIGTGREYIQRQREILLRNVPNWFRPEVGALFYEDAGTVFKASHILFHPYMIFDPRIDHGNGWIREVVPRLTIVTSWSTYKRMNRTLFQLAPQLLVCNRRVGSASRVFDDTRDEAINTELESRISELGVPKGVFVRAFDVSVIPFGPMYVDDDELSEDEELL